MSLCEDRPGPHGAILRPSLGSAASCDRTLTPVLWSRHKRVRSLVANRVRIERGSLSTDISPRVAVIAHWSSNSRVTKSVCSLVHELQSFGYQVVVSSACEEEDELAWGDIVRADELVVIRKPNIGYDFGSWSVALGIMPEIASAERVLIANDSMIGPFLSMRPLLEEFESTAADAWGLTDSRQFAPHLQSYFLGFRNRILSHPPIEQFWADVRDETEKLKIIFRNEIGLSRLLREEGYAKAAAFPHEDFVRPGENPVIVGWERLLEQGFPFLKREILRDPTVAPSGQNAPAVVRRLVGIDVNQWVDERAA
jgi:lipopolysaccharide biosynthesis protein